MKSLILIHCQCKKIYTVNKSQPTISVTLDVMNEVKHF